MTILKIEAKPAVKPEPAAAPKKAGIISTNDMVTEEYSISDRDLVARFATDEELKEIAEKVRLRRAAPPKSWPWVCPSCRWSAEYGTDTVAPACLQCGAMRTSMRRMSDKEAKAFREKQAAELKEYLIRRSRAGLAQRNADRARSGLAPLTIDEFREEQAELARRVR